VNFIFKIALISIALLLGLTLKTNAQTIAHKKVHWTVGADTLKGTTEHTIVLAGQSFIGGATSTTYTLHAGFFPVVFNNVPTDIIPRTLLVPENNNIGDTVFTINTTDEFELNDGYIYSLISGDGDTDNALFTLSEDTISNDTLYSNIVFDYEIKNSYSIRLQTNDGDYGKFEKAFTIEITDNNDAPDSIKLTTNTVGENAVTGTLVGIFSSRDQDTTNTHTYAFVAGTGDTDNTLFSISNDSLYTNASYDYEGTPAYSIRIQTTDNKSGTYDSAMVIDILNENDFPADISHEVTDVLYRPENESIGATVLNLSSTDQDVADTHTYTLVAGEGDTDNAYFGIIDNKVVIADTLNYELGTTNNTRSDSTYYFRVQTADGNGGTYEEAFTISTYDVNDAPHNLTFLNTNIRDDKKAGDGLGKVRVLDEDLNVFDEGDYHIFGMQGGILDNDLFTINASDGNLISAHDFSAADVGKTLVIRVFAKDSLSEIINKDFELNVISSTSSGNVAPLWVDVTDTLIMDHNTPGEQFVELITEDDPGETHTYELISGIGATHNAYFTISGNEQWLTAISSIEVTADSLFSVRVKSTDNGGLFVEDIIQFWVIPFVDSDKPVITIDTPPEFIGIDKPLKITATITDNTVVKSASIHYKDIIDPLSGYTTKLFTDSLADTYTFDLSSANYGGMGVEFYLSAVDTTGNEQTTLPTTHKVYIEFSELPIPSEYLGHGGGKADWRIFSIPFILDGSPDFQSIFGTYGTYDKTKWRLVQWDDSGDGTGSYVDVPFTNPTLGKGYWFNAVEPKSISVGAGNVNTDNPFELKLQKGFNQIGNPFNVPISWTSVLANNPNTVGVVDPLQTFANGDSPQLDGDEMPPFSGGFVFSSEIITIDIDPVKDKFIGGRLESVLESSDLSQEDWILSLSMMHNNAQWHVGSLGMHPEAKNEKDHFDQLSAPRFQTYAEIFTEHQEFMYPWFRRDIVTSIDEYTWDFIFETNLTNDDATLTWQADELGNGSEQLILFNKENGDVIDMRMHSNYRVSTNKPTAFSLYFNRDATQPFIPNSLIFGDAYPNPTNGYTIFPVVLPENENLYQVELFVYDLYGKVIAKIAKGEFSAGIHQFQYDFNENAITNGIYIYELKLGDQQHSPMQKKIVINK